jgi:hypothetical protein
LEDLIVERIILKWAFKSVWGVGGMHSFDKVARYCGYVSKSFGLHTKEGYFLTNLGTCYRVLDNIGKYKFCLFSCPELFSQTYCVDSQVADAACSATAYLCGVKNNKGTIGVTARVKLDDCISMNNASNQVSSIVKWFQVKIFCSNRRTFQ